MIYFGIRVRKAIGTPFQVGEHLAIGLNGGIKVLMGLMRRHPDHKAGKQVPAFLGLKNIPNVLPTAGKQGFVTIDRGRTTPKRVKDAFAIGDNMRNVVKELKGN